MPDQFIELQTARLRLIPLSVDHLKLCQNAREDLAPALNIELAEDFFFDDVILRAIRLKIGKLERLDPAAHDWATYWMIVIERESGPGIGAGMVGFKGAPNSAGSVEIGYGIAPSFRNRGFMTEAAQTLIDWAFTHSECQNITATNVLRSNKASQRALEKMGMERTGTANGTLSWVLTRAEYEAGRA